MGKLLTHKVANQQYTYAAAVIIWSMCTNCIVTSRLIHVAITTNCKAISDIGPSMAIHMKILHWPHWCFAGVCCKANTWVARMMYDDIRWGSDERFIRFWRSRLPFAAFNYTPKSCLVFVDSRTSDILYHFTAGCWRVGSWNDLITLAVESLSLLKYLPAINVSMIIAVVVLLVINIVTPACFCRWGFPRQHNFLQLLL